jgi:hypothetical protein
MPNHLDGRRFRAGNRLPDADESFQAGGYFEFVTPPTSSVLIERLQADNRLLAMAWNGWTPDRNTQTDAEAEACEAEIESASVRALGITALSKDRSVKASEVQSRSAMDHLGDVLMMLADLSPDDRCRALDEALAFYNAAARPDAQIAHTPGYVTRLVQITPLDHRSTDTEPG